MTCVKTHYKVVCFANIKLELLPATNANQPMSWMLPMYVRLATPFSKAVAIVWILPNAFLVQTDTLRTALMCASPALLWQDALYAQTMLLVYIAHLYISELIALALNAAIQYSFAKLA